MTRGTTCGRARTGISMILLGALVVLALPARSQQFDFNQNCSRAWSSVLDFRFSKAQALLALEGRENPGNIATVQVANMIDFLILFTGEERAVYDALEPNREKRLSLLEKLDGNSPWTRYCQADIYLQWGFARLKFQDYPAAALDLKRAYSLLTRNQELYPGFLPNSLELGVLHAMVGVIPDNYQWIAHLVGLKGSVTQGIGELEEIIVSPATDPYINAIRPLACLFEALIMANLSGDSHAAIAVLGKLDSDPRMVAFTSSPVAIYVKSSIYLKTGNNEQALAALASYSPAEGQYPFYFLYYLKGIGLLNNLDPSSEKAFRQFLGEFKGVNYVKAGYQKMAWNCLLQADTTGYRRYMKEVLVKGEKITDEDRLALCEASSGRMPAVPLLKARLLFDGGYYLRAEELLLGHSLKDYIRDRVDLTEYYYRLGRICQESGYTEKAQQYYRQAITTGRDIRQYYAAGAALQLGLLLEVKGQYASADSNYRLCIRMPNEEYKTSLSQKAKAGINRINQQKGVR